MGSKATLPDLLKVYDIDETVLGMGAYGKVFSATDKMDPSVKIAIKCIEKRKLPKKIITMIKQEVHILQNLDHPNVVRYFETYESKDHMYLCMELMSTELLD